VTTIRPLGEQVAIKATTINTSQSPIISAISQELPSTGIVIAVGEGHYYKKGDLTPLAVKVGDAVLFNKNAAMKLRVGDEDVLMLKYSEILAVISNP
jgi:chaperonin GroES